MLSRLTQLAFDAFDYCTGYTPDWKKNNTAAGTETNQKKPKLFIDTTDKEDSQQRILQALANSLPESSTEGTYLLQMKEEDKLFDVLGGSYSDKAKQSYHDAVMKTISPDSSAENTESASDLAKRIVKNL